VSKINDFLKTKSILKSRLLGYRELLALSFYDVDFIVGQNPTYTFLHAKTTYSITEEHLQNALAGQNGVHFIRNEKPQGIGWFEISIKNKGVFWTSEDLLTAMKDKARQWIT